MKLRDLIEKLDGGCPFVVMYTADQVNVVRDYNNPRELTASDEYRLNCLGEREISTIWFSRNLYGCIVIDLGLIEGCNI